MYESTFNVSKQIVKEELSYALREDVDSAYNYLKTFDFILILSMLKKIMGIINIL